MYTLSGRSLIEIKKKYFLYIFAAIKQLETHTANSDYFTKFPPKGFGID